MTHSENIMVFLGYKQASWLLMKGGNCSWIEWKSYLHANPSQLTHAVPVMWLIGTVLLFHMLYACSFCALLVKWYTALALRSRVL